MSAGRLCYKTVEHAVELSVEPIDEKVSGLRVEVDGQQVGHLELSLVWDFLVSEVQQADPSHLGMKRRQYEASNVYRLTDEWIRKTTEGFNHEPPREPTVNHPTKQEKPMERSVVIGIVEALPDEVLEKTYSIRFYSNGRATIQMYFDSEVLRFYRAHESGYGLSENGYLSFDGKVQVGDLPLTVRFVMT